MKVHRINAGTLCPRTGLTSWGRWPCLCLVVETGDGLVLVDTGLGVADCLSPGRVPEGFRRLVRPALDPGEAAIHQIRDELRLDPTEVRHVVITHLDLDHAGGLADFPWAKVHVHAAEYAGATLQPRLYERTRYLDRNWSHSPHWELYADAGDEWFGFRAVRPLRIDGAPEIALVPLFGHSRGHSGVAVQDGEGWLLHAGDAVYQLDALRAPESSLMGAYFSLTSYDNAARLDNIERLRELADRHAGDVEVTCSHDAPSLAALSTARDERRARRGP